MMVGPQYPAFPGSNTQGLAQKRSNAPFIILGVLGIVLIAVIAAFAFIISHVGRWRPVHNGPTVSIQDPPPPPPPGHPEIPFPPGHPAPPDPGTGTGTTTLDSLKYPGAKESFNVHGKGEGTIIMSTSDPSSKVVDWYVAKLPDADVVSIPFAGGAVITKGQTTVTITPSSPATMIVLAVEKKAR